eukprot:m.5682 g.5682  ORF g.5682 m.5682 type:complete len:56 (+) comp13777_c0_seq2:59-226(+)
MLIPLNQWVPVIRKLTSQLSLVASGKVSIEKITGSCPELKNLDLDQQLRKISTEI